MKFDTFINTYFELLQIRPISKYTYQSIYRNHVTEYLKNKQIQDITKIDIQSMLSKIQSPSVRSNTFTFLKSIFREALNYDVITINPMNNLKNIVYTPAKKDFITWNELKHMNLGKHQNKYLFLATHGLRISEALALTSQDIRDGYVHIEKSIYGSLTKSGKNRRVPYVGYFESDWLKTRRGMNYLLKKNAGVTLHSLRKTYAHLLKTSGVHPQVAQKLLGHSSIKLTMDLYTEVLPEEIEDAGQILKKAIGKVL
jgi:integrase